MTSSFRRIGMTGKLLEVLEAVNWPDGSAILTGDMETPPGGGWSGAGPDAPGSAFTSYWILTPLVAVPGGGSLADSQADWKLPYALQCYGVSRAQCENLSGVASDALNTLVHQVVALDDADYGVQQIVADSLGAVQRVPATNPPYYGQTDQFTLWLGKRKHRS